MPKIKEAKDLPDVQNEANGHDILAQKRINKVGIRQVLLPCRVERKDGTFNDCSRRIGVFRFKQIH